MTNHCAELPSLVTKVLVRWLQYGQSIQAGVSVNCGSGVTVMVCGAVLASYGFMGCCTGGGL